MGAPAGWYPTPEGQLRYWDGARWTAHLAPAQRPAPPPRHEGGGEVRKAPRPGPASWFGYGGLALCALLGLISSGVSGLLTISGVYVLVVAVVDLVRGRVRWAHLRSREAGGIALTGAMALMFVGAATASPAPDGPTPASGGSGPTVTVTSTPSPPPSTGSASPTPTVTVTVTPTPTPTPSRTTTTPSPETAARGTALAAVADLAVKGRAPRTGYDRDRFGQAWYDLDRNGCDTRNDVLRRDLEDFTLKAGTNGCLVLKGTLHGPYTGKSIHFVRGTDTSSAVQIDHVVALSDAWQKGAQRWSGSRRQAFANDPLNLLAVDGPTNAAKGDGDAATWLPPRKGYRCAYAARIVAVKVTYDLWVTSAERDALVRILSACPDRRLPSSTPIPLGGGKVVTVAPSTPKPSPSPTRTTSSLDPRLRTCGDAIDAGYGPYYRGKHPEYDWYRDADSDGIVCER